MEILAYMEQYGHEQLSMCVDPSTGLRAFIAIHDTTLGPALGGVRVWAHPTENAGILDVLRLSRAMTYKSAMAGLHFGGGKALILANPQTDKTEALMRAFGKCVENLNGRYITTEDVGMTLRDLEWISKETPHVTGLPISMGGSGDTSEMTGYGVYQGMRACAKEIWGTESLAGCRVAIQGFGHTATALVNHLLEKEDGVILTISDINKDALRQAQKYPHIELVEPNEIYDVECDIFAPCALGGVLNSQTIPRLKCKIVSGSANNQLFDISDGDTLTENGILYAPDYVINAGGVINVSCEVGTTYDQQVARTRTSRIYETLKEVIATSKKNRVSTARTADQLAEKRIAAARKIL